jgi:hypothetical protein
MEKSPKSGHSSGPGAGTQETNGRPVTRRHKVEKKYVEEQTMEPTLSPYTPLEAPTARLANSQHSDKVPVW